MTTPESGKKTDDLYGDMLDLPLARAEQAADVSAENERVQAIVNKMGEGYSIFDSFPDADGPLSDEARLTSKDGMPATDLPPLEIPIDLGSDFQDNDPFWENVGTLRENNQLD